jgi:hypothetical protein
MTESAEASDQIRVPQPPPEPPPEPVPAELVPTDAAAAEPVPANPAAQLESYELPTARQVVGRGLQLAYDSTRDLRRASLYIGLCTAAVVGPFALLLLVDIPKLGELDFSAPEAMSPGQAALLVRLIGPLYGAGALALLGFLAVQFDGFLMAIALLAGRAVGRPLELREALARARQVFWRYGLAAFVVGVISTVVTLAILFASGAFSGTSSLGASLLASFISTLVVLPFGYIDTAIVIGDVTSGAALRRSIVLVRARIRLAFAVAAFALAASALQTFGLGIAAEVAGLVADVLHPDLDLTGTGLIVAIPLVFVALMALGSLVITVDAVTVAPQVAAFLGLTRYSGGIDRARRAAPGGERAPEAPTLGSPVDADAGLDPELASSIPALPQPTPPPLPTKATRPRWITIPMVLLIGLEALIVVLAVFHAP